MAREMLILFFIYDVSSLMVLLVDSIVLKLDFLHMM